MPYRKILDAEAKVKTLEEENAAMTARLEALEKALAEGNIFVPADGPYSCDWCPNTAVVLYNHGSYVLCEACHGGA